MDIICNVRKLNQESGFSLLEVLIAMLVLSIGLLSLAGLQATSLRFNSDAQLRGQATLLAYDMVDRMRANRNAANDGAYTGSLTTVTCDTKFNTTNPVIATNDLNEWQHSLGCLLPHGTGEISITAGVVTITVNWAEDRGIFDRNNPDTYQSFSFSSRL